MNAEYKPLFTKQECRKIQARLMVGMNKYKSLGITREEAYAKECGLISEEYDLTRDELLSELAKSRNFHTRKGAKIKKSKKEKQDISKGFTARYTQWCQKNDYVSSDAEVSFWANCTPQNIGYARQKLSENGFTFEKNGHGYFVKAPVAPKMYTQQEVALILEGYKNEILSKFGRV